MRLARQWGVTLDLALMDHFDLCYICVCALHRSGTRVIFGEERWQLMSSTQVMVTMDRGSQGGANVVVKVMLAKVISTRRRVQLITSAQGAYHQCDM